MRRGSWLSKGLVPLSSRDSELYYFVDESNMDEDSES